MDTLIKYKKPLLIIAGILVLVEVVWGVYTLSRPVSNTQQPTVGQAESVPASSGSVTLKGPAEAKVGENLRVDMELTTNSQTDGADLIIKYDPKVLDLVTNGTLAATVGKTYQDYPANSADPSGVITISGVSTGKGFSGTGVFATIKFSAKATGTTKVSVDFTAGSTTDSNVTESSSGRDILESVNNLEITVTN